MSLNAEQIERIQSRCDELIEKLKLLDGEGAKELIEKAMELKRLGFGLVPHVRPSMEEMKKIYPLLIECLNACIEYGIIRDHKPWTMKKELVE